MEERRRFYRIDDSVILNYRPFPEEQMDETISRLEMLKSQHKLLQNSLGSLELRLDFLLDEITEPLPEIAEALKIINRKISILSQLDSADTESALGLKASSADSIETHEVNLSGSGLAFFSPTSFSHGETMEIECSLLPEYFNIKAIGRVVDCRETDETDSDKKYRVAVDFIYLRETDREFMIAHILKKQGDELKEQRKIRETGEVDLGALA
jgi:hypothetical protein